MVKRIFHISIALSLVVHLLFGTIIWIQSLRNPRTERKDVIEVVIREAPKTPEDLQRKQIVEQNQKSLNEEVPEDAKYWSQTNQRVIEETKAAQRGTFANKAQQNLAENQPRKQKKSTPRKLEKSLPSLDALKPAFDWNNLGDTGQRRESASASDDYLKDVQTGVQTMLNTREFLYYSYYNRIKAQLKQYWEPKIKDKMKMLYRQGRTIASDQDRITKVIIHLDNQGILTRVQVIGESGVRDLDDAAVEAFRAAAPFPNPPKGIIDTDGTIKIRWDFILEAADSQMPAERNTRGA